MELAAAAAAAATDSPSSLSFSASSSSSSSLNLSMSAGELIMNSRMHGRQDEERFFLIDETDEGEHHFLESCFLCKKPIPPDHEIFIYRGDEPFCSEKCRTEMMEMDEALETVERRHRTKNYTVRNGSEKKQQNNSMFCLQKKPTVANLTACGLLNLQNFGFATHAATFMEP